MVFRSAAEDEAASRPVGYGQSLFGNTRERASRQHEMYLQALRGRQNSQTPQVAPTVGPGGSLQDYARGQLSRYGFNDPSDWDSLYRLWMKESSWNPNAVNRSSGAFGIAQTLPSAHPTANRNMSPQQQIDWGLNYIRGRYGSPTRAWQHSQRLNWY